MGQVLRFNHHLEAGFNVWQREAACLGQTELFYPTRGEDLEIPKALCRECYVRPQCLDYALTKPENFGIWGGLSERERKRLRRRAS
jgi:WhiB family redox-sensing transcriptional regulator